MKVGRGFAQNVLIGQQAVLTAYKAYKDSAQAGELGEVADAKAIDTQGFTEDVAKQLDGAVQQGYDNVTFNDGTKSYTAKNAAGDERNFSMQNFTDFLGRHMPGTVAENKAAIDGIRMSSMADVVGRRDPVKAMQMRHDLSQDEREEKRFQWEQTAQPMKQRQAELNLATGERQERQGGRVDAVQKLDDDIAKMPLTAIEAYASRLNMNGSQIPMLYAGRQEDGYRFLTVDPKTGQPSGKEVALNEAQLRQMAGASILGQAGYGQESMSRLNLVNKDVADHIKSWNDVVSKTVTSENDAKHKGNQDSRASLQLGEQIRHNRAAEGIAERKAAGTGSTGAFNPFAGTGFNPEQMRKQATDQALEETKSSLGSDGKPMSGQQIAARAEEIYSESMKAATNGVFQRQATSIFAKQAESARSQEEVEALRAQGKRVGMSDEDMSRIDPRFSAKKQADAPAPASARYATPIAKPPATAERAQVDGADAVARSATAYQQFLASSKAAAAKARAAQAQKNSASAKEQERLEEERREAELSAQRQRIGDSFSLARKQWQERASR